MMVTMMRTMEVATTTLIITIVGSEEGKVIVASFSFFIGVLVAVTFVCGGVMMISGGQVELLA